MAATTTETTTPCKRNRQDEYNERPCNPAHVLASSAELQHQ